MILAGSYSKENMQNMLSTFLLCKRITKVEYDELMDLMEND